MFYAKTAGITFNIDTKTTITGATTTDLWVRTPTGRKVTWSGSIDGTQVVTYTTSSGDHDEVGKYKGQAYVVTPSFTLLGEVFEFEMLKSVHDD